MGTQDATEARKADMQAAHEAPEMIDAALARIAEDPAKASPSPANTPIPTATNLKAIAAEARACFGGTIAPPRRAYRTGRA